MKNAYHRMAVNHSPYSITPNSGNFTNKLLIETNKTLNNI